MNFTFINRNYPNTIALLPGWATDQKIFDNLNIHYNYIIVHNLNPFECSNKLNSYLNQINLNKVSLFGWSMGAYIADQLMLTYPEKVSEIILISAKPNYPLKDIQYVKKKLSQNRVGYLYQFYKMCFSKYEINEWRYFKKNFLQYYLETQTNDILMNSLDFLSKSILQVNQYEKNRPIKIIQGQCDEIAPLLEIQSYLMNLNLKDMTLKIENQSGHIPFLKSDFQL